MRYLGTFLDNPLDVPVSVLHTLAKQLDIDARDDAGAYRAGKQRWQHAEEIRVRYGYVADFADLHFGDFRPFMIFNVADACISIGVLLLVARALLFGEKASDADAKTSAK